MLPDILFAAVIGLLWKLGVIELEWYVPKWLADSTTDL